MRKKDHEKRGSEAVELLQELYQIHRDRAELPYVGGMDGGTGGTMSAPGRATRATLIPE